MLSLWEFFSWNGASAALTQADASLSATTNVITGTTASLTQADASLSATAGVTVGLSASLTQANASLSATAAVLVTTTASLTQANAALSATAAVLVSTSASLTQADAALSAAAAILVSASAALTQSDALTASESEVVGLSAALTQDDFALSADVAVTGGVVRRGVGRASSSQRVRIKPRKAWERTFSRNTWAEVQALLKAEQEALDKAVGLEDARAKAALESATDAASDAIDELNRQPFIEAGQVARLTRALEGAAGAKSIKATLRQAQLVNEYAAALMAHMAEMEDEDEAIVLLMM